MDIEFLRPFVVDRGRWELFQEHLTNLIDNEHKQMEQATDPIQIHRSQGAVTAYRRLYKLRENITNG